MGYEKLNPKAKLCMYVSEAIGFLITAAVLITARLLFNGIMTPQIRFWANVIVLTVITLYFLVVVITPSIRYRRYKYLINDEKIDVIEGLIFISREIVPIERIQKIDTRRGPIDSMFGLANVIVTTAGGEASIHFLELEKADMIAEKLKTKINAIVQQNRKEVAP